jgi:hypothetical protein
MLSRLRAGRGPSAATWLAWLLPVFAWAPLTYPGYFEFLNGFAPIFNLDDFWQHASRGWAPSIGQGYDLLRGEGILPYLLAVVPRALGASGVTAVKFVFIAAILAGALGTYGWARRMLGDWPGLLAACVYAFWPLGLATVYVRGAIGEALLLGLMPFVWWAASATLARGGTRHWIGLAVALALALWTQAGLALWLAVFVLAYVLVRGLAVRRTGRDHLPAALAGLAGGLLAGGLDLLRRWLAHGGPGGAGYPVFADHFVYPHQLLQAGWGLGPSIAGPYDLMPFQLGLAACALAAIGAVLWPAFAGRAGDVTGPALGAVAPTRGLAVALALLPAFLSLTLAAPLWSALPFLARTLAYPWQLLLLSGPWLAWLAGAGGLALTGLLPELSIMPPDETNGTVEIPASEVEPGVAAEEHIFVLGAHRPAYLHATVPLFAALIGVALLGVYGNLNPPAAPVAVPDRPLAVLGENEIAMVSAVLSPTVNGVVTATVQWQALRPLTHDYTVFFHAEAADGSVWGQQDTIPGGGQAPTSGWRPGAVLEDRYSLSLEAAAPAGVHYVIGMYDWQTGRRMPAGADDKVVIKPRAND